MYSRIRQVWNQRPGLHTRLWVVFWIIASSVVIVTIVSQRGEVRYDTEIQVLSNSMSVIAFVLTIGFPIFSLSSIILGTSATRKRIIELSRVGMSSREVFFRIVLKMYALVMGFCITLTVALFLEPWVLGIDFPSPSGSSYITYFPAAFVTTSVISLILVSFGILLVTVTDDVLISAMMGILSVVGIQLLVWWISNSHSVRLLSPMNFITILAGHLSGFVPPEIGIFAGYFGLELPFSLILTILIIFIAIAIVSLLVSFKLFQTNMTNWMILEGKSDTEIWESEPELWEKHRKIRGRLKVRRRVTVFLVLCLLVVMAFRTNIYASSVVEQTTFILHESPDGGEAIILGEWTVISCDVQPAQYSLESRLRYRVTVEDWENAPDNVDFYYEMLNMTPSEFQSLNETERRSLLYNKTVEKPERGYLQGTICILRDSGLYTFALKAIASDNETLSGVLYCSIQLTQSAA
ncbi:MAG: hypothetical protein ThorAB25_25030 [Candidatus Thorarchaeota archaeon AB_25]|nr:MAG: hypothetical protein ThorAB25_25030 [Candidatus Thorarchaeota archaeon AB_25]